MKKKTEVIESGRVQDIDRPLGHHKILGPGGGLPLVIIQLRRDTEGEYDGIEVAINDSAIGDFQQEVVLLLRAAADKLDQDMRRN